LCPGGRLCLLGLHLRLAELEHLEPAAKEFL